MVLYASMLGVVLVASLDVNHYLYFTCHDGKGANACFELVIYDVYISGKSGSLYHPTPRGGIPRLVRRANPVLYHKTH